MAVHRGGTMEARETQELAVRKTVTARCSVEHAFRTFTSGIGTWWPLDSHSVGVGRAQEVVLEAGVGGRIYERWDDGTDCEWGRVTVWEPPVRVAFSWKPNREAVAPTKVDIRFSADGDVTLVELEHRGWERLGERACEVHASYASAGGWTLVVDRYAEAANTD